MKNKIFLLIIIVVLGAGFYILKTRDENTRVYYLNNDLGIKFKYTHPEFHKKLNLEGNRLYYKDPGNEIIGGGSWGYVYIELFVKNDNENIEEAILNLVRNSGKDPSNCRVVKEGDIYTLDLSKLKTYNQEELGEIEMAEIDSKKYGGPVDGDWKRREIYNNTLIDNCTEYADRGGLGTSKTVPSYFLYNGKDRFVFFPAISDPSFYEPGSFQFIK